MSMELGAYTNFHELNQDWFLNEFNKVLKEWTEMKKSFNSLNDAFNDLYNYVHDYFKNLDVQEEIAAKRCSSMVGKTEKVLIEGENDKNGELCGRTSGNIIVELEGSKDCIGTFRNGY